MERIRFIATFKNLKKFKALLNTLKELLLDLTIVIDIEKMSIIGISEDKKVMVDVFFPKDVFSKYECHTEKIMVCIDSKKFYKSIQKIANKSVMSLFIDETDYNEGIVSYIGLVYNNKNITKIKLQEIETEMIMKNSIYEVEVIMKSLKFHNCVFSITESDETKIFIDDKEICFKTIGEFSKNVIIEEIEHLSSTCKGVIRSTFNSSNLKIVIKATQIDRKSVV